MSKTIEEAAKEAVRKEYFCESCAYKDDCDLCGGENTAFDCCECPAESYEDGFKDGASHVMSLPLSSRLTDEEKQNIKRCYKTTYDAFKVETHPFVASSYMNRLSLLESIFGPELFKE